VTEYSTQNIDLIDDTGSISLFAAVPAPAGEQGGGLERYLAIAPGFEKWSPGDLYVTQGAEIYKVSSDGSSVAPFATIPDCGTDHTGITFDHYGTFGYDMIVTCQDGGVWQVNASGSTPIANVAIRPVC
jgi:hypothetical protein